MVRDRRMMGRERSELSYSVVHVHDVGKFTLYGAVDMQLHLKLSNPRDAVLVRSAVASAHVLTVSILLYRNCQTGTCSLTSKEEFIDSLFINLQRPQCGCWRRKKAGQSVEGEKPRSLGLKDWAFDWLKRLVMDVSWWYRCRRTRGRTSDKLPGSGLCNHSGSKVPSGLKSPWY